MASTKAASGMLSTDVKRDFVTDIIREVCETHGLELLASGGSFEVRIGPDDASVEANAILAVNETLERLGVQNFQYPLSRA